MLTYFKTNSAFVIFFKFNFINLNILLNNKGIYFITFQHDMKFNIALIYIIDYVWETSYTNNGK